MSGSYSGRGRDRSIASGMVMILVLSVTATIVLLVAGLIYYSGSSARTASDYTAVAAPANLALTGEVNGYTHHQRDDLAAARSDLRREARTEASFDTKLAALTFPGAASSAADVLIQADQKRVKLIGLQAQSTSLRELRSFNGADQSATAAVEVQVGRIRQALGLPPASGGLF